MMIRSERRKTMYAAWTAGVGLGVALVLPSITVAMMHGTDYASLWAAGYPVWDLGVDNSFDYTVSASKSAFLVRAIGSVIALAGAVWWGVVYSKYHMRDKVAAGSGSTGPANTGGAHLSSGRPTSADGRVSW